VITARDRARRRQARQRAAEARERDLDGAANLLVARLPVRELMRFGELLTRIDPHKFRVVLLAAVKALPPAPEPSEAEWSLMSLGDQLREAVRSMRTATFKK
jgi:hypothetical protein